MLKKVKPQYSLFDINRQILINNLYGVDLNRESVEITKLSLWIKTANKHSTLTSLDENIKCGNSLCNSREIIGDTAFDWEIEFSDIMEKGGFDIIIGNPPYLGENRIDEKTEYRSLTQNQIYEGTANYIRILGSVQDNRSSIGNKIIYKLKESTYTLDDICDIRQGIVSGADKVTQSHINNYEKTWVKGKM